jgi:hypothetical protein
VTLFLDAPVAVVFLVLAIRYNSLWLGAAMMFKGVQLSLHATHLTDEADSKIAGANVYSLELCFVSLLISAALIGGTFAAIRERRARRAVSATDLPEPTDAGLSPPQAA